MKRFVCLFCVVLVVIACSIAAAEDGLTLTVNRGTKDSPKPVRTGSLVPLPGFFHNPSINNLITPSEPLFQMEPENLESPLYAYIVRASARSAQELSKAAWTNIDTLYETIAPMKEYTANGITGWYFLASGAEPFAAQPGVYVNDLFFYLPGPDNSCVMIDISQRVNAPSYLPEAEMLAYALAVIQTIQFQLP